MGWRLKVSIFDDIKTGLLQAIAIERERRTVRSHLGHSKKEIKQGKTQPVEEAVADLLDEIGNEVNRFEQQK